MILSEMMGIIIGAVNEILVIKCVNESKLKKLKPMTFIAVQKP